MRTYLSALFGVCLVSAIIKVISPEGATKKYIEMLCSLCVISAVIFPMGRQISEDYGIGDLIPDIEYESESYDEIYNQYLLDQNIKNACEVLRTELCERLGTDSSEIEVKISTEDIDGEIKVRSVSVILGVGAITADPDEIKEYIYERTECECEIIYEIIGE